MQSTAATGAGLSLSMCLPLTVSAKTTEGTAAPVVNAWVVVKPDDKVIFRIACSEMGQGILTGLAQLAAKELEYDWSKVGTEYPAPRESLANDRI